MMYLSKCGPYYYVYFVNPATGKRTKISTRSKKKTDAYKFLLKFDPNTKIKYKKITISEFKNEFLIYAKIHYSAGTFCLYERSLRQLVSQISNIILKDITRMHIESFKINRIANKVSKTTVNMEFRALKAMFNFAIIWKLIETNPCEGIKQFKIFQKEILSFNESEISAILEQITIQPLKDFVLFALLTGCRLNEITQLQWKDIDLINNTLIIRNKPGFKTKSGRIRILPVSNKLRFVVDKLSSFNAEDNNDAYVFLNHKGLPFEGNYLSRLFKKELRRLKFSERYHFHCLRHTFITNLVRKGVNIYDIKHLAGHVNIETTELYMHNITDDLRKAVNLI